MDLQLIIDDINNKKISVEEGIKNAINNKNIYSFNQLIYNDNLKNVFY